METEEKTKINVYYCENRHMTFTSEPIISEWMAPVKITCPKCQSQAESCYHPESIQENKDFIDLIEIKFFKPADFRQIQKSLEVNRPNEVWTMGRAKDIFDKLNFQKQFFYIKVK
jgi:hypothetical protein